MAKQAGSECEYPHFTITAKVALKSGTASLVTVKQTEYTDDLFKDILHPLNSITLGTVEFIPLLTCQVLATSALKSSIKFER